MVYLVWTFCNSMDVDDNMGIDKFCIACGKRIGYVEQELYAGYCKGCVMYE